MTKNQLPQQSVEIINDARAGLRADADATYEDYLESGSTQCHGYTLSCSQALSAEGIEHRIGFMNKHSTLFVPDGDAFYMIDPFNRALSQRIDTQLMCVRQRTPDIQVGWLSRLNLIEQSSLKEDEKQLDKAIECASWLDSPKTSTKHQHGLPSVKGRLLITSIYQPELGRQVVTDYMKYRDGSYALDMQKMAAAIISMSGVFPDLDTRGEHLKRVSKGIVKQLAMQGEHSRALEVTGAFFSSFDVSGDSRVKESHGDSLRYIARFSGSSSLAQEAIKLYQAALSQPKSFKSSLKNKIAISQKLITTE